MKLHDALTLKLRNPLLKAIAQQQVGENIYEVAVISDIPIGRECWQFTKRKATKASGSDYIISQKDTLDEIIETVDNYPGFDPSGWSAL